ncbi:MAG: hypothetical protein LIO93_01895 [Bacteroidales bacterium]|nr:hypothetical protein [Bacteroidales bacterium]
MKSTNLFLKQFIMLIVLSFSIFSCSDNDDITPPPRPDHNTSAVLILNEGDWSKNNASLSYFNPTTGTTIADIYNGQLGETGQDIELYGNKIYISVAGSGLISVLEKEYLIETHKIKMEIEGLQSLAPQYMESYNGKIYVTCQESNTRDGYIVRIDTTSLKIDGYTLVGKDPVDLAITNGKIYVANSGGSNYPNVANTLSVVNLRTFKEEEKLTVGLNPFRVKADGNGNIYLTYQGVVGSIPGGFQRVDTYTKEVFELGDHPKQDFQIFEDKIYFYDVTHQESGSTHNGIGVFDMDKQEFVEQPFISDETVITNTPYGIGIHPQTKDVYLSTTDYTTRGKVLIFNQDGIKQKEITVGINPKGFIFF